MLLHSVMTIVLGVLITGDAFTPRMLVGGAITLVGVFIIAVRSGKQPGSAELIANVEQT
jgi:drug/metabolite transporter (DMT)-like permease